MKRLFGFILILSGLLTNLTAGELSSYPSNCLADTSNSWSLMGGEGSIEQIDTGIHITGDTLLVDPNSPLFHDGEVEFCIEMLNDLDGIGFLFYSDEENWRSIDNVESAKQNYYTSEWSLTSESGVLVKNLHSDGTPLVCRKGMDHHFKVRITGEVITLWMDYQVMFTRKIQEISSPDLRQLGFRTSNYSDVILKDVVFRPIVEPVYLIFQQSTYQHPWLIMSFIT